MFILIEVLTFAIWDRVEIFYELSDHYYVEIWETDFSNSLHLLSLLWWNSWVLEEFPLKISV